MRDDATERSGACGPSGAADAPPVAERLNRTFGPIVAGLIIDLVDFATFGPIGFLLGLPVGGLAGYWMGRCLGLGRRASFYCALASGVYCTIPGTEVIPLATMVGAYVRFRESGRATAPSEAAGEEGVAAEADSDGAQQDNRV